MGSREGEVLGREGDVLGREGAGRGLMVGRVVVDAAPAHLDRLFDYRIPPALDEVARPGVRVRVPLAGRQVGGYLVSRVHESSFKGQLAVVKRVVGVVPVLTPEVWRLVRAVADRGAGSAADVLRLAIPPRRAGIEPEEWGEVWAGGEEGGVSLEAGSAAGSAAGSEKGEVVMGIEGRPETTGELCSAAGEDWSRYVGGPAFIRRLSLGESPRAVWSALPWSRDGVAGGPGWVEGIVAAVEACVASGRGAVVVLPDARDVRMLEPHLRSRLEAVVARLVAEDGPTARYRAFLEVLSGKARVVVGTRSAAYAPVRGLGLAVIWDDGASTHREPRHPYPHARDVLALRCEMEGAGMLIGSVGRSAQAQRLIAVGWARELKATREVIRAIVPRIVVPAEADIAELEAPGARVPAVAREALLRGLGQGPVLVQVPSAGYLHGLACARCRTPLRCRGCGGGLGLDAGKRLRCRWCGGLAERVVCRECGGRELRSSRVGAARTAEEFGRAFPEVPVVLSSASGPRGVVDSVGPEPALVVATPEAEPSAFGGYAAAALLDGWLSSAAGGLEGTVRALGRWMAAASLVRPASQGGRVVLVGWPADVPAQGLVRWDPGGVAARDLAEREELRLPPAARMIAVTGEADAVEEFCASVKPPGGYEMLGPVPCREAGADTGKVRALLRCDLRAGKGLVEAVATARGVWSMSSGTRDVKVEVDPAPGE